MSDIYIACEEMDFTWTKEKLQEFSKLWKKGLGLMEIAEHLDRDPDEVAMLIMDHGRLNKIKPSIHVVNGNTPPIVHQNHGKVLDSIDPNEVHKLYHNKDLTLEAIARRLSISMSSLKRIIYREREKHPEKWPSREAAR